MSSLHSKLLKVQYELKAPKGQYNSFGKYKYRSCEDILEALKPVADKHQLVFFIADRPFLQDGWHYIEATVTAVDTETGESLQATGYAREAMEKKGMDSSQVTGTASSYARKYALNGLLLIDDTKDDDTRKPTDVKPAQKASTGGQKASKTTPSKANTNTSAKAKQALADACERYAKATGAVVTDIKRTVFPLVMGEPDEKWFAEADNINRQAERVEEYSNTATESVEQ